MATSKNKFFLPLWVLYTGVALIIVPLFFYLWVRVATVKDATLAEAEAAVQVIESNLGYADDSMANRCWPKYNDEFLKAADVLARLESPDSLQGAEAQLGLAGRLGEVAYRKNAIICGSGRQANTSAVLHVARNVYKFLANQEMRIPHELLLHLLNGMPGNESALQNRVKRLMEANGCIPEQKGMFTYSCKE